MTACGVSMTWIRGTAATLLFATALAPLHALAYTADGHEWTLACNANGYVLRSTAPVSRQIGAGAGRTIVRGRETLTLGRSCDARHSVFGVGTWCWANGGFGADFRGSTIRFGGQELFCRRNEDRAYSGSCRC